MIEPTEDPSEPASDPVGNTSDEGMLQPASAAIPSQSPPRPKPARRRRWPLSPCWTSILLFLAACGTTFWAGFLHFPAAKLLQDATGKVYYAVKVDPETNRLVRIFDPRQTALNGLMFSAGIMLTLAFHELGHYLQARRYRVPGSPPMFIPMPIGPFGTMGAVIFQQPGVATRKSLFDIAISGPLAGLVVALPLNWWGVKLSKIGIVHPNSEGWTNPKIVEWMVAYIHRPLGPNEDISLNPILFAGWVGLFITALNLVPIGQLDGGHLLYCLLGKRAWTIARLIYIAAVSFVAYQVAFVRNEQYLSWVLMLVLVGLMGPRHPPTADDTEPLGLTRIILGWLTLAFIFVGFVSTPQYVTSHSQTGTPASEAPAEPETSQLGEDAIPLMNLAEKPDASSTSIAVPAQQPPPDQSSDQPPDQPSDRSADRAPSNQ